MQMLVSADLQVLVGHPQAHKKDSLLSSDTRLFAQASLRTQVQIPRSHVKLGMSVHVCGSSIPTEMGDSPEA